MNVVENDVMNVIREFQIYFVICMIGRLHLCEDR